VLRYPVKAMKFFLLILPISILFQQDFYAKLVNRTNRYGPYIAVQVKTKKYSGTMVTENIDLYRHYHIDRKWTSGQYVPYMHLKIANKDTIHLPDKYIDEYQGYITPALEVDSSMTVDKVIEKYFHMPYRLKVFKDSIPHKERLKVVRWLFEHQVECRELHEVGMALIDH
jgi:hypothetical protein